MAVALIPSIEEKENLHLELNISTTLKVSAPEAKRKVNRFFMDKVSLFIGPQPPLLVVVKEDQIVWRFPIVFSMGQPGQPYKVGEVDVDAFSGQLLINDALIEDIKVNARLVAISASTPLATVG
jgi:hypothetical protein